MTIQPALTPEGYATERAICDRATEVLRTLAPDVYKRGGAVPEAVTSHPDYLACDSAMQGRVGQFELLTDTPAAFVAYVGAYLKDGMGVDRTYGAGYALTVWTGDRIGRVTLGAGWRVNSYVGSRMYQAYATVNGREFTGRTFGEGMSVTLRETAASKRKRGA